MRITHTLLAIFVIRWARCGGNNDAKEALKGAEKRNPPELTHPESSLASKIDSSLFNVEEAEEDTVKVLKLTPKGDKVTQVKYDNKEVWSGSKIIGTSSNLVEALIYFYEEIPVLTTIRSIKGGTESTVYRYYDGSKWKDGKEGTHKKKFEELKKKAPKTPSTTVLPTEQSTASQSVGDSSNIPSSNQDTLDLEKPGSSYRSFDVNIQGVPTKVYASTSGNTVKKVTNGKDVVWTATSKQKCLYCIAFLKDNKLSTVVVQIRENEKISYALSEHNDKWEVITGHPIPTKVSALKAIKDPITKISLDISLAESNDDCAVENYEYNRFKTRLYAPKNGKAINKITDGDRVIGTLNDTYTCYLCELYSKSNISLLRVHTETDYEVYLCHYMNDGSKWETIKEEEFGTKLGG